MLNFEFLNNPMDTLEMTTNENQELGWEPCSSGVLQEFAKSDRIRRKKAKVYRALNKLSGAIMILFVGAGLGLLIAYYPVKTQRSEKDYAGITCADVRSHADAFWSLPQNDAMRQKIAAHMSICKDCQQHLEGFRTQEADSRKSVRSGVVVRHSPPSLVHQRWLCATKSDAWQ